MKKFKVKIKNLMKFIPPIEERNNNELIVIANSSTDMWQEEAIIQSQKELEKRGLISEIKKNVSEFNKELDEFEKQCQIDIETNEFISCKEVIALTYPHDAHLVKVFLESNGIKTFIKDELTVQVNNFYSNAIGGVKIIGKDSDYEQSIYLLKNAGYVNDNNSKFENKIEVFLTNKTTDKKKCPFCGSDYFGKKKEIHIITIIAYLLIGAVFPIFKLTYKCHDCHKEWKYEKE